MQRHVRVLILVITLAVIRLTFVTPVVADEPPDFALGSGWFFTQTGEGDGSGYAVTDADGIEFWMFFQQAGGVSQLGYPISGRWTDGPFTLQAFQKAILQWLDGRGVAYLNIYDRLNAAGQDAWLDGAKNVPRHRALAEDAGQPFDVVRANHLALLDANPAIKARWFENSNWLNAYGLPLAYEEREGLRVLRAQRAVFQQWLIPTSFTDIGGVVIANGGDHFKQAGLIPAAATTPQPAPTPEILVPTGPAGPATGSSRVVPQGLALPVNLADITVARQTLTPFGLYRHSKDREGLGHGGIDLPMVASAPFYAMAAGTIVSDTPSVDFRPGRVIVMRITSGDRAGEGWVLIYEHITLAPGLRVGSDLRRGQLLGNNAMDPGVSNNHVELAYAFNNLEFWRLKTCWPDQLADADRTFLSVRFNDTIRTNEAFIASWRTAADEGFYPYRALLDAARFPEGAQLCYPVGTDVREPVDATTGGEVTGSESTGELAAGDDTSTPGSAEANTPEPGAGSQPTSPPH